MRAYEHGLFLADVENFDAAVERIDLAATKATIVMRAIGMALPGIAEDRPPTLNEVDTHLRALVSVAYRDLLTLLKEPIAETEGFAADDLFDVSVVALQPYDGRRIRVEIALILA